MQDSSAPEDLSAGQSSGAHGKKSKVPHWVVELSAELRALNDEFVVALDDESLVDNYCLHFFWRIDNYKREICQAFRDDEISLIKTALSYTLPFVMKKSLRKLNLSSKEIVTYLKILAGIVDDYLGPNACASIIEAIKEFHDVIDVMRGKTID